MALMDFTEEMENVAVVFMGTGDQVSEFRRHSGTKSAQFCPVIRSRKNG